MSRGACRFKGLKAFKAFLISLVILLILLLIIGLLLRYTSLPERWASFYMLGALCAACFLSGLFMGGVAGKRGILVGILAAAAFLLLVIILAVLITGTYSEAGLFKIKYISCLIAGGIGGLVGVSAGS